MNFDFLSVSLFVSESVCLFWFTHRSDIAPFKLLHVLKQPRDRGRLKKDTLNLALSVQVTRPTQAKSNSPPPWLACQISPRVGGGEGDFADVKHKPLG